MAPTHFLPLFLFLLMSGHIIGARDLKLEFRDDKQRKWYKATSMSNDESYTHELTLSPEFAKPNYIASYGAKKHNHHHENLHQPYKTYESNTPYIASYRTTGAPVTNNQPNYDAVYGAKTHDSNAPYLARYRTTSAFVTKNQPNKDVVYEAKTHDFDVPYIAAYNTTSAPVTNNQPNYDAVYGAKTHDSNAPYLAEYRATSAFVTKNQPNKYTVYEAKTHGSDVPYIAAYRTTNAPVTNNRPNYDAMYGTKTFASIAPYVGYTHQAYITSHDTNEPSKESSNEDTIGPYITQYGGVGPPKESSHDTKEASKESSNEDTTGPYITQYGRVGPPKESSYDTKEASKESSNGDTIGLYITQYGEVGPPKESSHDTKEASKESSNEDTIRPYITQYGRVSLLKKSSKVDHTEAFKTGFFGIDDLHVGNVMTLQFPVQEIPKYLSRKEADSIPFSTSQLPSVLQLFSIPRDSLEANAMRFTLDQCEAKPIIGETKICVTSLESMLEFVGAIIGSEVKYNILTTSYPTNSSDFLQKYTILEISEDINAPKWVACHPQPYPYAVYYCHFISTGTKVFRVSLSSENGDNKIEALGVCHLDTSEWSPDHIIFKQLGIKPGKAPVCHFFPVTHVMWVPQSSQATK